VTIKVPVTILGCQYETTGYGEEIRAIVLNLATNDQIDVRTIDLPVNFDRLKFTIPNPKGSLLAYRFPDGVKYYDTTLSDDVCAKLTHLLIHPTCGFPDHEFYQNQIYEPHGMLMVHCSPVADGNSRFRNYTSILRKYPFYIGRTTFEAAGLVSEWVNNCNIMDEIHVQSTFNKREFEKAGVKPPIYVFPCGVNSQIFKPRPKESVSGDHILKYFKAEKFNFLSIFESHFQNYFRKGLDILLQGYFLAFNSLDLVNLVIKTNLKQEELDIIAHRANEVIGRPVDNLPQVTLVREYYTIQDLALLYNVADAYVLPSRGEGLGIPFLEALCSAIPTIGTRWSGNMDFMNDDNSILIELNGMFKCHKGNFPSQQEYWGLELANPSFEDLAAKMRRTIDDYPHFKRIAIGRRDQIAKEWDSRNKVKLIADRILKIAKDQGISGDLQ